MRFRSWNGGEQQVRLARRSGQQFEKRDEVGIIGDALGESAVARRCRFRFNLGEEPIPAARAHDARVSAPQQRSLGAGAPR
jgi:hypothetical protein